MQKLTEKQKRFCDFYIADANATEAAIKAGYSKKTAGVIGDENLKKPYIKIYIDDRLKKMADDRIADATEVMEYLTNVLRGRIEEETVVVEAKGDFESRARIVKKQVAPKDRNKAAELLAKRYGILTEKVDVSITDITWFKDDEEAK